jgi:hypothetical protein
LAEHTVVAAQAIAPIPPEMVAAGQFVLYGVETEHFLVRTPQTLNNNTTL